MVAKFNLTNRYGDDKTLFENASFTLQTETGLLENLEHDLLAELKEVKHLEHNLASVEKQLHKFKILFEKRYHLMHLLLTENHSSDADIDVKKAENILNMIQKYDFELNKRIRPLSNELYKLQDVAVHKLVGENLEEKTIISTVDARAKELSSEFMMLQRDFQSYGSDLSQIKTRLQQIVNSKPTTKAGF